MIAAGKKAPAFQLDSAQGAVSLGDFAGKWLVLYFYPRDNTPGCTTQALAFQGAKKKFADKCSLDFALLSDPDKKAIEAFGAWGEKVLYGKKSEGILRSTVIIDPAGKVARVFEKVKVAGHADAVLAALEELGA